MPSTLTTKNINELLGKYFWVPDYQRGYRWQPLQVEQLLDDILGFYSNHAHRGAEQGASFYCLQPIVVKPVKNGQVSDIDGTAWEVIDGQQRLTTLYIVLKYLGQENLFSIYYQTRPGSAVFLEKIGTHQPNEIGRNIDYYHFDQANTTVGKWFNGQPVGIRGSLKLKMALAIMETVKVIWYEIQDAASDARDVFTRLNMGKIPLTDAELVRALFLGDEWYSGNATERELQKARIAIEWDQVEQDLQNPEFWAFLQPDTSSASHISLLLDLIARDRGKKYAGEYGLFRFYEQLLKDTKPRETDDPPSLALWQQIKKAYLRVREWYEDRELYHLIGYLLYLGHPISDLYNLAEKLGKEKFKNKLRDIVRSSLPDDLDGLSYNGTNAERDKLQNFLLLFNIAESEPASNPLVRFSFRQYRDQKWSLEHIHAQNSKGLTSVEQWIRWIKDHRKSVLKLQGSEPEKSERLIQIIDQLLLKGNKMSKSDFDVVFTEVMQVFAKLNEAESELHDLSNLALLDKDSNSALGNSIFDIKRSKMIEYDKEHRYIMPATRNVFLKYYSAQPDHLDYWTEQDRVDYLAHVKDGVTKYVSHGKVQVLK